MPLSNSSRVVLLSLTLATVGLTVSARHLDSSLAPVIQSAGRSAPAADACALLTSADIAKTTGLKVGDGTAGPVIPGVLGRCTWIGGGDTKVIVTLTDTQHMQTTLSAQLQAGGNSVSGVGSKAVATRGAGFTGGGHILSVLDTKGGIGVSILGKDGTQDRVIALAQMIESRR
jgi:hypothetical protein